MPNTGTVANKQIFVRLQQKILFENRNIMHSGNVEIGTGTVYKTEFEK
jgi:hypothetical protein